MALTDNDFRFLLYSCSRGLSLNKTLLLGRLRYYGSIHRLNTYSKKYGTTLGENGMEAPEYSEPLLKKLGAEVIESIDHSNYEGATLVHDLNIPVSTDMHQKYTAVIDGGTIEHVFNFPVAIASCMNMIAEGGYYIGITPCNNLIGHGFYQFSPELYYRIFSEENGFTIDKMIITASKGNGEFGPWYEVVDPALVGERVEFTNCKSSYLLFAAKKNASKPVFSNYPQQSDYVALWKSRSEATSTNDNTPDSAASIYNRIVPFSIRKKLYPYLKRIRTSNIHTPDFGNLNSRHFKKMKDY